MNTILILGITLGINAQIAFDGTLAGYSIANTSNNEESGMTLNSLSFNPELDTIISNNAASFPSYMSIDENIIVASAGWENTTVADKAGAIYI